MDWRIPAGDVESGTVSTPLARLMEGEEDEIMKGTTVNFLAAPSWSPDKPFIIIKLLPLAIFSNHLRKGPQTNELNSPRRNEKSLPWGLVMEERLSLPGKSKTL
jgi:hypothetical protein